MLETYLEISADERMYVRHNKINAVGPSLMFVHGLGDSGLSFEDAFKYKKLAGSYNIIVPDLIGYGRSSGAAESAGYKFDAHIGRLWKLIDEFGLSHIILLGHSMGGDITALMCQNDFKGRIEKYINIEGDVTQHELFISSKVVKAYNNGVLEKWFYNDFMQEVVFKNLGKRKSGRLHFASLNFCRLEALLENSQELVERNTKLQGEYKSEIGQAYLTLKIPRVFCYGTESLSAETLHFLQKHNMQLHAFPGAGHSLMVDSAEEFYGFVHEFAGQ